MARSRQYNVTCMFYMSDRLIKISLYFQSTVMGFCSHLSAIKRWWWVPAYSFMITSSDQKLESHIYMSRLVLGENGFNVIKQPKQYVINFGIFILIIFWNILQKKVGLLHWHKSSIFTRKTVLARVFSYVCVIQVNAITSKSSNELSLCSNLFNLTISNNKLIKKLLDFISLAWYLYFHKGVDGIPTHISKNKGDS